MVNLIIIRGPLGVGKTTISKKITTILKAKYFSMDNLIDGKNRIIKKKDKEGMIDVRNFLYANTLIIPTALKCLNKQQNVVVDGCFYHKEQIVDLIKKIGKRKIYVFDLKAPLEVCIERDKQRKNSAGTGAAVAVHNAVSKFNYGIKINTIEKKSIETVHEIIKKISKN